MAITFLGAAEALPGAVLTSSDVESRIREASGFRLPSGVVEQVTGIRTRRMARDDEYASTLAIGAGAAALARAGVRASQVDLMIFASASRDFIEPATAHVVADALGITGQLFDVTNACNSFINGVEVARAMMLAGGYERALVVTGETPTRSIRWRLSSMREFATHFAGFTFGDAGAAVVLGHVDSPGIGTVRTVSQSQHWEAGGIFGGGSRRPFDTDAIYFSGSGSELRIAFEALGPAVLDELLADVPVPLSEHRFVLVHQVTTPYRDRFLELVGARAEQLVPTVEELGNVASATLPIQLARCWDQLESGDRCLLVGLGGGISVSACSWEVP